MKRVGSAVAAKQIKETLISIHQDGAKGKLKTGDDVHPFHRVTNPDYRKDDTLGTLGVQDIASLLQARLEAQGYVLLFDAELARQTLDKAMSRLEGFLRSRP